MEAKARGVVELVNAAAAETFELNNKERTSAIRKRSVGDHPVTVLTSGIEGDDVGDHVHHGGPNRAIHLFSAEHYDVFSAHPDAIAAPRPWVGENLTVRGYTDAVAHIGDQVRIGTALMQVTMPTERCALPGLVTGMRRLRAWMVDSLRTGFYLRVLEPGQVSAGDRVQVVERGHEKWSIEALSGVMYRHAADADIVGEVEQLPTLAPEWKTRIRILHERHNGE